MANDIQKDDDGYYYFVDDTCSSCSGYKFRFMKGEDVSDKEFFDTMNLLYDKFSNVPVKDCAGLDIIVITKLYPKAAGRYDPRTRTMFFEPYEEDSAFHELGHFVWRKMNDKDKELITKEWELKRNKLENEGVNEKDARMLEEFGDLNSWKNTSEYFADSYREYHKGTREKYPAIEAVLGQRYKDNLEDDKHNPTKDEVIKWYTDSVENMEVSPDISDKILNGIRNDDYNRIFHYNINVFGREFSAPVTFDSIYDTAHDMVFEKMYDTGYVTVSREIGAQYFKIVYDKIRNDERFDDLLDIMVNKIIPIYNEQLYLHFDNSIMGTLVEGNIPGEDGSIIGLRIDLTDIDNEIEGFIDYHEDTDLYAYDDDDLLEMFKDYVTEIIREKLAEMDVFDFDWSYEMSDFDFSDYDNLVKEYTDEFKTENMNKTFLVIDKTGEFDRKTFSFNEILYDGSSVHVHMVENGSVHRVNIPFGINNLLNMKPNEEIELKRYILKRNDSMDVRSGLEDAKKKIVKKAVKKIVKQKRKVPLSTDDAVNIYISSSLLGVDTTREHISRQVKEGKLDFYVDWEELDLGDYEYVRDNTELLEEIDEQYSNTLEFLMESAIDNFVSSLNIQDSRKKRKIYNEIKETYLDNLDNHPLVKKYFNDNFSSWKTIIISTIVNNIINHSRVGLGYNDYFEVDNVEYNRNGFPKRFHVKYTIPEEKLQSFFDYYDDDIDADDEDGEDYLMEEWNEYFENHKDDYISDEIGSVLYNMNLIDEKRLFNVDELNKIISVIMENVDEYVYKLNKEAFDTEMKTKMETFEVEDWW